MVSRKRPTGPLLVALRERLGLSPVELARASKLDRPTISRLESGANQASRRSTREALAKGFRVPVARMSAYLDGFISLDELDPSTPGALEVAVAYHEGRWSERTVAAARRLPLRHLTPEEWAEQLDAMETAHKAAPTVWAKLADPEFDVIDNPQGSRSSAPKKKTPKGKRR